MLVYVPPTITYFYGFKRTLIRVDIIDIHHFSKSGFSGFSGTVKYLALCQILTPLIESSPIFLGFSWVLKLSDSETLTLKKQLIVWRT